MVNFTGEVKMDELAIYGLMIQYPVLRDFIVASVKERKIEELLDFLMGIEVDEDHMYKQTA